MEPWTLAINVGLLVLTGVAAVAAVVQARMAHRAQEGAETAQAAAESARDEATRLSKEANAAFVRQAEAQERANEIELSKLPADGAKWQLEPIGGIAYVLRNIGNRPAVNLTIHEMNEPSGFLRHEYRGAIEVMPADVIEFYVLATSDSPNVKLQLRWSEGDGSTHIDDTTIVVRAR